MTKLFFALIKQHLQNNTLQTLKFSPLKKNILTIPQIVYLVQCSCSESIHNINIDKQAQSISLDYIFEQVFMDRIEAKVTTSTQ